MSKTYEMIAESLNEIIQDLEENDGKNLRRETLSIEKKEYEKVSEKKFYGQIATKKNIEQAIVF